MASRGDAASGASELIVRYLRQIDLAIPGAIEGFYVVGSIALGAFRPGRSDVDFVAVLGDRLDAAELSRLRRARRRFDTADPSGRSRDGLPMDVTVR